MLVELVHTLTRDGLRLDGGLAVPDASSQQPAPPEGNVRRAALLLHGVGSNFYSSSTLQPLAEALRCGGYGVLLANTRGHDLVYAASVGNVRRRLGAAYETVADCCLDVAAWVELLAQRGFTHVTLIGHSLGAIKAVYSQAHQPQPQVQRVVAISPPRLSYAAFRAIPESSLFEQSLSEAQRLVASGQPDALFTCQFPFPLLITAAGYLDKYGPAERYNILRFAANIQCPTLFVYGGRELAEGGVAFAGMPEALMELPGRERRQVAVIDGADHVYTGRTGPLTQTVMAWLGTSVV